jgi:hypothetical protein
MKREISLPGAMKVAREFKSYLKEGEINTKTVICFEGFRDDALAFLSEESEDTHFSIKAERS